MAIALVQKATATGVSATSITTPAFASATTAGNVLLAQCAAGSTATVTFSDSKSNTWTSDAHTSATAASGNISQVVAGSASITTGGSSHTVTASKSPDTNGIQLVAEEWSGLTKTVDKTATATANSSTTSLTATTAATANASDLLIACFGGDTNTTAVTMSNPPTVNGSATGVTSLEQVTSTSVMAIEAAYSILSSTGTQAVAWSYNSDSTGAYAGVVVTYQASAGGGPTVHPYMMMGMGT